MKQVSTRYRRGVDSLSEWINCADTESAEFSRAFYQRVLAEWPQHLGREDVISRFQSGDQVNSEAAAFELFLFSIIRSCGYSPSNLLMHHNRKIHGSESKPEFYLSSGDGPPVFIEATLTFRNDKDRSFRRKLSILLNNIGLQLQNRSFQLSLNEIDEGDSTPSARRLAASIDAELSSLDWESERARLQEGDLRIITVRDKKRNFAMKLTAIPILSDGSALSEPILLPAEADWESSSTGIIDCSRRKRRQHWNLDARPVLAIGSRHPFRSLEAEESIGAMKKIWANELILPESRLDEATSNWSGIIIVQQFDAIDVRRSFVRLWKSPTESRQDLINGWPFEVVEWLGGQPKCTQSDSTTTQSVILEYMNN